MGGMPDMSQMMKGMGGGNPMGKLCPMFGQRQPQRKSSKMNKAQRLVEARRKQAEQKKVKIENNK